MSKPRLMFNGRVFEKIEKPVEGIFATSCLICHEDILVYDPRSCKPTVCKKCRAAVMKMREKMEVRDE